MKTLHVVLNGELGGIQTLTRDILMYDKKDISEIYYVKGKGFIADEISKNGFYYHIDEDIPYKHYFAKARRLMRYIDTNNFDLIVFHFPVIVENLLFHWLKKRKIPFFVYEHCDVYEAYNQKGFKMFFYKMLYKRALKMADAIIAISKYVKEQGKRLYPNNKSYVIYNGVNLDKFKKTSKNKDSIFTILYVGRLVKEKGVDLLIDSMKYLNKEINFKLIIVGDGNESKTLKEKSEQLGISDKIEFVETTVDVQNYYTSAHYFVHPAIWNEGFGITLVESLASGVPCITFCSGAMGEIIKDGYNGFIVKNKTKEALASTIKTAYDFYKSMKYEELCNNAYESSKRFSIQNTIEGLKNVFSTIFLNRKYKE